MAKWLIKAAIQGTLSLVPASEHWNFLLQRYVTKGALLNDKQFGIKAGQCRRHVQRFQQHGRTIAGTRVLELGTGWHPVVPLGLFLCGSGPVWTFDLTRHLRIDQLRQTANRYLQAADNGNLGDILPHYLPQRVEFLQRVMASSRETQPERLLAELDIHYKVQDVCRSGLPDSSVDLLLSNNTLEHIPPQVILAIFREFSRVASPGALMSHHIDLKDHYSFFDASLNEYNFLRYPDFLWRFLNSPLHYQNRLRVGDYRRLHVQGGFRLLAEENDGGDEKLLPARLATGFRGLPSAELAVTTSWMVSERKG